MRERRALEACLAVVIFENARLNLHLVYFQDRVTFNQLRMLGALHQERKDWAAADTFYIVREGADLSDLDEAKLDIVRAHYRALHESLDLFLVRRAAWLCREATACDIVEYWLKDRHSRDGQGAEVILVADVKDAAPLFSSEEIGAVEMGADFVERARLEDEPV